MNSRISSRIADGRSRRNCRVIGAALALLVWPLVVFTGCGDELEREFRQAAIGGLETGLRAITDGLLDGLFAVADPNGGGTTGGS